MRTAWIAVLLVTGWAGVSEGSFTTQKAAQTLFYKLDPPLAAMVRENMATRVEVRILVRDAAPQTLDQLRQAGLEAVDLPGSTLQVTGRIPVERLSDLTQSDAVRYVIHRKTAN